MRDFHKLRVWACAHELELDIYRATRRFPKDELYGLRSQMRRAAVSICANIAEGYGRRSTMDFARFLDQAHVGLKREVTEVKRMLGALLRTLRADRRKLTADG